jgi:hypothetical protein
MIILKKNTKYDELNQEALEKPQPGDYWHERFLPYFIVVDVKGTDITVLSCLGGERSHDRKHEPNAKIEVKDGWYFDYSKYMVVDQAWIKKAVTYDSIDGFVADVIRREKTQETIVTEWRNWMQKDLRRQIQELEDKWETFTGWKYLK